MTVNRIIKGSDTFKEYSEKICKQIKVDTPQQHMRKTAAIYLHKHLKTGKCRALLDKLIIPKRETSHIYTKHPQLGTYCASLDKTVEMYNKLPAKAKLMTVRQFRKYCKKNEVKQN